MFSKLKLLLFIVLNNFYEVQNCFFLFKRMTGFKVVSYVAVKRLYRPEVSLVMLMCSQVDRQAARQVSPRRRLRPNTPPG